MAAADDALRRELREGRDDRYEIAREIERLADAKLSQGHAAHAEAEHVTARAEYLLNYWRKNEGPRPDARHYWEWISAVTKWKFDYADPEHQVCQLSVLVLLLRKASFESHDESDSSTVARSDMDEGDRHRLSNIMKLAESIIQEVMALKVCGCPVQVVPKLFIVFDGIIGCGKSEALKEIQKRLPGRVKVVSEPVESAWRKLLPAFYEAVQSLKTAKLSKRQARGTSLPP